MKKKNFTLIEILIVVSLIAILVSLLLPALNRAARKADAIACLNQLKQIGLIDQNYTNDNQGKWTVMAYMEYFHPNNSRIYNIYYPQFYWRQGYLPIGHGNGSPGTFYIGKSYCCPSLLKHFNTVPVKGRYLSLNCYATRGDIRKGFDDYSFVITSSYLVVAGVSDFSKINRPSAFNLRGCTSRGTEKILGSTMYCQLGSTDAPAGIHSKNANMIFLDGHAESVSRMKMIMEFGGSSSTVFNYF